MVSLSGDWSGKIVGTNNSDIFVEIAQIDDVISGTLRINDPTAGIAVYRMKGVIDGSATIQLELDPTSRSPLVQRMVVNGQEISMSLPSNMGHVSATAKVITKDRVEGRWKSSIGTAGTLWIARATSEIETASKYLGEISDNVVFVLMAISEGDPSLQDSLDAIKRAAISNGLLAVRVDEIEHSGRITEVVLEKLKKSRFLVCDVSNERPNVYYELGYAHGINRPVILVAKQGSTLHFDVKDYNVVFYKNFGDLETRVSKRIAEALGRDGPSTETQ